MSPYASPRQRRYLYAKHPEIAKRWTAEEKTKKRKRKKIPKPGSAHTRTGLGTAGGASRSNRGPGCPSRGGKRVVRPNLRGTLT